VRILKDLERAVFVSADSKEVTGEIPGVLDVVQSREDGWQRNISHYTIISRIVK
jgi:hypothetical protein